MLTITAPNVSFVRSTYTMLGSTEAMLSHRCLLGCPQRVYQLVNRLCISSPQKIQQLGHFIVSSFRSLHVKIVGNNGMVVTCFFVCLSESAYY